VSKPNPPRKQPAPTGTAKQRPASAARKPTSGRAPWLLLAVAVAVGVVALVWLTGRPDGQDAGQPAGATKAVGQTAPPVLLQATNGKTVDVTSYRGKRNVLLYFYEHAG
jgi:cytochrome oxidase Cu insertion factor (SCO1/SenC/PrrC family)